jgi:hypothetical protein
MTYDFRLFQCFTEGSSYLKHTETLRRRAARIVVTLSIPVGGTGIAIGSATSHRKVTRCDALPKRLPMYSS